MLEREKGLVVGGQLEKQNSGLLKDGHDKRSACSLYLTVVTTLVREHCTAVSTCISPIWRSYQIMVKAVSAVVWCDI